MQSTFKITENQLDGDQRVIEYFIKTGCGNSVEVIEAGDDTLHFKITGTYENDDFVKAILAATTI